MTDDEVRALYLRTHDPFRRKNRVLVSALVFVLLAVQLGTTWEGLERTIALAVVALGFLVPIAVAIRIRVNATRRDAGDLRQRVLKQARKAVESAADLKAMSWLLVGMVVLGVAVIVKDIIIDEEQRYRTTGYFVLGTQLVVWLSVRSHVAEAAEARDTLESLGEAPAGA